MRAIFSTEKRMSEIELAINKKINELQTELDRLEEQRESVKSELRHHQKLLKMAQHGATEAQPLPSAPQP
jgi:phage-related minor tail protein